MTSARYKAVQHTGVSMRRACLWSSFFTLKREFGNRLVKPPGMAISDSLSSACKILQSQLHLHHMASYCGKQIWYAKHVSLDARTVKPLTSLQG